MRAFFPISDILLTTGPITGPIESREVDPKAFEVDVFAEETESEGPSIDLVVTLVLRGGGASGLGVFSDFTRIEQRRLGSGSVYVLRHSRQEVAGPRPIIELQWGLSAYVVDLPEPAELMLPQRNDVVAPSNPIELRFRKRASPPEISVRSKNTGGISAYAIHDIEVGRARLDPREGATAKRRGAIVTLVWRETLERASPFRSFRLHYVARIDRRFGVVARQRAC